MPDADETIITKFVVDTDEAIENSKAIRQEIDLLKQQMKSVAGAGTRALKDFADGMKEELEKLRDVAKIDLGKMKARDVSTTEEIEAAEKEIDEYTKSIKRIGEAFREVKEDRAEYWKVGDKQATESTKKQTQLLKQSKAAQVEYAKITKQGYGVMSVAATKYGQNVKKTAQIIQQTAQRSGQSWNQVGQRMARLGTPINQVNAALQQLNTQSKQAATGVSGLTSKVSKLGTVGKYVFGTVLGLGAVTALRDIARGIKEVVEVALDFQQKMFAFEISVRALQRVGLEATLEEWYDILQNIKDEFPIFSKRDITEAGALAGLMTREFGFTTDQIENVIRMSASLSLVWGKDLTESVRGLTYAISAGYFESLQRVGIQISRNVVRQEALRQGYEASYNALNEQIRAAITYDIVMDQMADLTEDTTKLMELQTGQVAALRSNWDDLKVSIGGFFIGLFGGRTVEKLRDLNTQLKDLAALLRILSDETKKAALLQAYFNVLKSMASGEVEGGFLEQMDIAFIKLRDDMREISELAPMFEDILTDTLGKPITIGGMEISAERYQELIRAIQELNDEILDTEEDLIERRLDLQDKFARDLFKRKQSHDQKMEDLAEDHQRKLDDIDTKAQQRRDDAIADYGYRVADVARDAAFRREEAERKYRERELKDERKFQEKLRQLRENFLFDLEDAVRERDARQIIRLTRQYNLRRDQMVREEKLSKDDRKDAFAEQLRQIEFQRQERLRQLAIEHARRLQAIDLQAERERERAKIEDERKQAAEEERWLQEQEDRKERYKEQNDDLDDAAQERIDKIIASLQKEYDLTEPELDALSDLYNSTYGFNGWIPNAIDYTIAKLAQLDYMMRLVQARQAFYKRLQAYQTTEPWRGLPQDYENAGEQAEGGTIIARKPTVAIFGEAGPEMATFTPLNKLAETTPFGGQAPMGARGSAMGKLRLEMLLSPDLEARIIDDTMNEVADVIYTIERERR